MRKTLQDVASYIKEIMVPATDDAYEIKESYLIVSDEKSIHEGVKAFKTFLAHLYDRIHVVGDLYDTSQKVAHEYENRTTLSVYYPFLHHVGTLLMKIGYHGVISEDAHAITFGSTVFNPKLSTSKTLDVIKFLMDCGVVIEGLNVDDKKLNVLDLKTIKLYYPENPSMLIGLKVLAIAEIDHGTLVNQEIFLRCDDRVLKKDETPVLSILMDTIRPLDTDVQKFILELHQEHIDAGLSCVVETKGFHIYIKYCYKRKDVWGINASLNNGYHINIKSTKTHEYVASIETFDSKIKDLIDKGYGCGRKRAIGHCDGGCRGIPIALDDSVLDMKDHIRSWLALEVTHLMKK